MVIFAISLDDERSKKRRIKLMRRVKCAKLDQFPMKIMGVDGRKIVNQKFYGILGDEFNHGYLKNRAGSKGCALSHLNICSYIKKYNIKDDVLVLEDDVLLHPNFLKILPKEIPEDYHVLFLHPCPQKDYENQKDAGSNIRKITETLSITLGSCYIINGKKIKEIIKEILPIEKCFDIALAGSNLNKYLLNPSLKISKVKRWRDSYREDIDLKNLKLFLKFLNPKEDISFVDDNTCFKICVDPSMTREYSNFKLSFQFFINEINANDYIWINNYIDIEFIENNISYDEIHFKFKPMMVNFFKYPYRYKLKVVFQYSEKYIEDSINIFYQK